MRLPAPTSALFAILLVFSSLGFGGCGRDEDEPSRGGSDPVDAGTYEASANQFLEGSLQIEYRALREAHGATATGDVILYKDGLTRQRIELIGRGLAGEFDHASVFTLGVPTEPIVCAPELDSSGFSHIPQTDGCVAGESELAGILVAQFGFSLGYQPHASLSSNIRVLPIADRKIADIDANCYRLDSASHPDQSSDNCFATNGALLYSSFESDSLRWSLEAVHVGSLQDDDFDLPTASA